MMNTLAKVISKNAVVVLLDESWANIGDALRVMQQLIANRTISKDRL